MLTLKTGHNCMNAHVHGKVDICQAAELGMMDIKHLQQNCPLHSFKIRYNVATTDNFDRQDFQLRGGKNFRKLQKFPYCEIREFQTKTRLITYIAY
ncbi:hypothetical protein PoB_004077700 [Plakobranchus ocellatus]|uniref:Uncharacterized protein n=1 Tax=Plakobranchus ocellatus TaxID=259542 RepID=A0AAV4B437_9GAST|nr:hypothetical protein PoB_004077700 [Plakobranchus ocellatus]